MGKKEVKGGSPKGENRCPVCGRFASKKVLDACKGMMSEVERAQKCEIEVLKKNLAAKESELQNFKKEYDSIEKEAEEFYDEFYKLRDELNKLKVENERLRERGFFDYLFCRH